MTAHTCFRRHASSATPVCVMVVCSLSMPCRKPIASLSCMKALDELVVVALERRLRITLPSQRRRRCR